MSYLGLGGGLVRTNRINRKFLRLWLVQRTDREQKQRFSTSYPEPQSLKQMTSVVTGQNTWSISFSIRTNPASQSMSHLLWIPQSAHLQGAFLLTFAGRSMSEDRSIFTWKHRECLLFQRQRTKNWTFMYQHRIQPTCRWGPVSPHPPPPTSQVPSWPSASTSCRHLQNLESKYYTSAEQLRPWNHFLCFLVLLSKWKDSQPFSILKWTFIGFMLKWAVIGWECNYFCTWFS